MRPDHEYLRLTLTVSSTGDVLDVKAGNNPRALKYWPQVEGEIRQWKFRPFEENGEAVTAEVEEYIYFVPPERLPRIRVAAPAVRPDSEVEITLERTGCNGACPSYTVTVSTTGIVFDGRRFVVARGKHVDTVDADEVRKLGRRLVAVGFYSMDTSYRASVTDNPTYVISIAIDGEKKTVEDYVGSWVGMPAVITELEDAVDSFARVQRWVEGADGLVQALQAEKFNLQTFEAQLMLKEVARRGKTATVRSFLEAGVPLKPLRAPPRNESPTPGPLEDAGWLSAASGTPETLAALIDAGASNDDQNDKDLALAVAAGSGNVEVARALIAYGANPHANLGELVVPKTGGMALQVQGSGSVLIRAAASGNPEMVREILRSRPMLELRDSSGRTAVFGAGEDRYGDRTGARVECLRLLADAGADVNARDHNGNTPLHETYLTDVAQALLKLGANVNAQNRDGETPIFTTVDNDAIPLFIKHGADLTIRDNNGQTVMEAAEANGTRQEALRKAIQELDQR
jgi:ankyrin repeat protein